MQTVQPEAPEERGAPAPEARSGYRPLGALGVAGVASICAGAIHATAIGTHSDERQVVYAFAAVTAFQIGWGVLALVRRTRTVALLGVIGNAACVGGWVLAKTSGISFIDGFEKAEAVERADGLAALLAGAAAIAALAALRPERIHEPRRWARPLGAAAAMCLAALAVTGMIGASSHGGAAGGHHATAAVIPPEPFDPQAVDLSGVDGVSPEQEQRAEELVTATVEDLPRYAETTAAEADGYRSIGDAGTGVEHYINWDYIDDEYVLDPRYPESVMYRVEGDERILEAAMFMLPTGETLENVPDIGGPLTQWHVHEDLCFTDDDDAPQVAGLSPVDEPCREPLVRLAAVPMIHVWIVANPCGPFAALSGVGAGQIEDGALRLCDTTNGDETPIF